MEVVYKPRYKFRGKDENNGNYVYGDLCNISSVISTPSIINKNGERIFVKSDSVAQLIGYDKNFKEIYEDDYLIDITNGQIVYALEVLKKEYSFCDIFSRYIVKESD